MAISVSIEGLSCTVEKLPSGAIMVRHQTEQFSPMHGPGTAGDYWYTVHPCQQQQYEFWNSQLPPQERATPEGVLADRPWWSSTAGERATLRE
jgi:hypothetical protein